MKIVQLMKLLERKEKGLQSLYNCKPFSIWRRRQDSNLQARKGGSFQDYCITNYATSP